MQVRRSSLPIVLMLVAAVAAIGFLFWNREAAVPARVSTPAVTPRPTAVAAAPAAPPRVAAAPPAPITADDVARWSSDATGGDAGKRAAAIAALAQAPMEQALPILRRVLMNGEPVVDRPLALQSLRDLALDQGDPNSSVRNAIREAIYHGDDQTVSADAQEALDVIEEGLAK
jgi:hypothetical protein